MFQSSDVEGACDFLAANGDTWLLKMANQGGHSSGVYRMEQF